MPQLPAEPTMEDIQAFQQAQLEALPILGVIGFLNALFVLPLTNAAVIWAVAQVYLGQPVTAVKALRKGLSRLLPLIGTSILMYLAIIGGMFLCIVPGILFALWFGLSQHVVVIEGHSGTTALGRSRRLVRPHLGTFLVLGIILFVIFAGLGIVSELIPQPHIKVIVSVFVQAVSTIFATAAGVVFYFSTRCAEENFDLHYLAEQIGREAPATEDVGLTKPPIR